MEENVKLKTGDCETMHVNKLKGKARETDKKKPRHRAGFL
jgi:hypothetical protein